MPELRTSPETLSGWHALTSNQALDRLYADPAGLDSSTAAARLERYGANALEASGISP